MSGTLRPILNQQQASPTSSTSSKTTTPTSPNFGASASSSSRSHPMPPVPTRTGSFSSVASVGPSLSTSMPDGSVLRWQAADVAVFLASVKCAHLVPAFERNDITGQVILELDQSHLKELGVDRVGDRVRLLAGLKSLKKQQHLQASQGWRSLSTGPLTPRTSPRGSVSSISGPGPTVVVTRGEDGFNQTPPQSQSQRKTSLPNASSHGLYSQPLSSSQTSISSLSSSSPTASIIGIPPTASAFDPFPRIALGLSGHHRPAPLSIPTTTTLGLPQVYQPSPHSSFMPTSGSKSSTSTIRGERPTRTNSPHPPPQAPPPKNALPPPPIFTQGSAASRKDGTPRSNECASAQGGATSAARRSPSGAAILGPLPALGLPPNPRALGQQGGISGAALTGGSFTERRANLAKEREGRGSTTNRSGASQLSSGPSLSNSPYRKTPASVGTGSLGLNGRPAPSNPVLSHPFAIATPSTPVSPVYNITVPTSSSTPSIPFSSVGGSSRGPIGQTPSSAVPASLEDIRRKTIKFINYEDGNSRVVDLTGCEGGVEIMEKVLKKFGKWSGGSSREIETESDDDGADGSVSKRCLCVDGWGVFLEGYGNYGGDGSSIPLSEDELLSICHAPPDSPSRERGLTIKRTRRFPNRKAIEAFFGAVPPAPGSPTSPTTYTTGPRSGGPYSSKLEASDLDIGAQGPSSRPGSGGNANTKRLNRASTVSVMSGLGVPLNDRTSGEQGGRSNGGGNLSPDIPSSSAGAVTPSARSPSVGGFLNRGRKMYNFFGHRPPSELISNHLMDYFPAVQRKVLEKTQRNSMLRLGSGESTTAISLGSPKTSWADEAAHPSARMSTSSLAGVHGSPRKKRTSGAKSHGSSGASLRSSHRASASPTRASAAAREVQKDGGATGGANFKKSANVTSTVGGDIPRLSISTDDGTVFSGSESDAGSVGPPRLPDFAPSTETLFASLGAFSPELLSTELTEGPPSLPWASDPRGRRGSNASASRLSMLSKLRKNRDRSDTASMLTVDEITAHVESKRASRVSSRQVGGLNEDGEGEGEGDEERLDGGLEMDEEEDALTPAPFGGQAGSRASTLGGRSIRSVRSVVQSEDGDDEGEYESGEEDEDEDEEYYSEDEEDDDEEDENDNESIEEDEHGKAFMSTGGKRSIKWIKGALIGSGSFGSVFLGMDAQNGLLMAVKQVDVPTGLSSNEERKKDMLSALEREIELLKELQHENIVQYLDSSIDANHLNIFLEYVPGGSVAALLGNYGAFEEALVRTFVRQTLQGLCYLHDKDIIHRDIKGANILVDNKGGIKISDFGISKKVESNLLSNNDQRKSLQGTVFWMAPEVVKQTAHTLKADIWSVGCLVVEMLTGQRPWGRLDQMQVMFRIGALGKPQYPPDITAEAENFLDRTFVLNHLERPSAAELLQHPFIIDPITQ